MRLEAKIELLNELAANPRYRRLFRDIGTTAPGEVEGSFQYRPGFYGQASVYVAADAVLNELPNWRDD